jgi:2',3'-cyclic-nucleotide 2'-phosphodiesterase (5'-nucleotidase family)
MKYLILSLLFVFPLMSEARLINIIHTNDLHSYFKGYKDGRGGYPRLKSKIEELKASSLAQGIEVLQLDGGDFGEGTSFFISDEGSASVKALELIGTDVSVIGNHDHMLGGKILGDQIRKANVKTKFVSANLVQTPEMNLQGIVTPFVDVVRAGVKIRVIGLSTAEPHFQYPLLPGFILPAQPIGDALSTQAKKEGAQLVIALTHIGKKSDINLAKKSSDIDIIVGGHSHTRMDQVIYQKNKKGNLVPIVQTGAHSLAVGDLLIDVADDNTFKVIDYKLHDITSDLPLDQSVSEFVEAAEEDRNNYFGGRWDDILGETLIPLSGYKDGIAPSSESCWGEHMAKMGQEATGADLSLHLAQFEGLSVDPGKITFGDMIENFPHFRSYGDSGWEISTITVPGSTLKILLKAIINLKSLGVNFYGVQYKAFQIPSFVPYIGNRVYAFGLRVNGKKIDNKAKYKIAFPSEVAYAVKLSIPEATRKLMPDLTQTGKFYWPLMENYIRQNSPIECLKTKKIVPILTPDE